MDKEKEVAKPAKKPEVKAEQFAVVDTSLLNGMVEYMRKQPFIEVAGFMNGLNGTLNLKAFNEKYDVK